MLPPNHSFTIWAWRILTLSSWPGLWPWSVFLHGCIRNEKLPYNFTRNIIITTAIIHWLFKYKQWPFLYLYLRYWGTFGGIFCLEPWLISDCVLKCSLNLFELCLVICVSVCVTVSGREVSLVPVVCVVMQRGWQLVVLGQMSQAAHSFSLFAICWSFLSPPLAFISQNNIPGGGICAGADQVAHWVLLCPLWTCQK